MGSDSPAGGAAHAAQEAGGRGATGGLSGARAQRECDVPPRLEVRRRARHVRRQLLLPVVLPHLRMLPAILRMIVPAVSDESRAGGTTAGNRPLGGPPWTGARRGTRRAPIPNQPVGHLMMHHQLHPFTRPPPAGSSRGRTGVRGVPVSVT